MLNIYLCGAVLVAAAAMMFPAVTPTPLFLAGLLWPIVVVGVIQMMLIKSMATVLQARAAHDGLRPLNAMALSSMGADASTGTAAANSPSTDPSAAAAETWDRTALVLSGSHS
jgi:hypothetical protein